MPVHAPWHAPQPPRCRCSGASAQMQAHTQQRARPDMLGHAARLVRCASGTAPQARCLGLSMSAAAVCPGRALRRCHVLRHHSCFRAASRHTHPRLWRVPRTCGARLRRLTGTAPRASTHAAHAPSFLRTFFASLLCSRGLGLRNTSKQPDSNRPAPFRWHAKPSA